jgi:hypothetical protein
VLGVTVGAVLTCSYLLGMDYLLGKIKSAAYSQVESVHPS